jgi:hypothetical protein
MCVTSTISVVIVAGDITQLLAAVIETAQSANALTCPSWKKAAFGRSVLIDIKARSQHL